MAEYIVQTPGETITSIARRNNTTEQQIINDNPHIRNYYSLTRGESLVINPSTNNPVPETPPITPSNENPANGDGGGGFNPLNLFGADLSLNPVENFNTLMGGADLSLNPVENFNTLIMGGADLSLNPVENFNTLIMGNNPQPNTSANNGGSYPASLDETGRPINVNQVGQNSSTTTSNNVNQGGQTVSEPLMRQNLDSSIDTSFKIKGEPFIIFKAPSTTPADPSNNQSSYGGNIYTKYDNILPGIPEPFEIDSGSQKARVYKDNPHKYNDFSDFNRYRLGGSQEHFHGPFAYLFFTTPWLNLYDGKSAKYNIERYPYMEDIYKNDPHLIDCLSRNSLKSFPYIKILTNRFKSFTTKDVALKTKTHYETFAGYKMLLPLSPIESQSADQFTIDYQEKSDLSIIKIHKLWTDYMEGVRRGFLLPSLKTLENREIDYFSSLYYFVLKDDGHTIQYFAKYTGVAPVNVPYSAMNFRLGEQGHGELAINYIYTYKEDLNPEILVDFNKVMGNQKGDIYIARREKSKIEEPGSKRSYIMVFNAEAYNPFGRPIV